MKHLRIQILSLLLIFSIATNTFGADFIQSFGSIWISGFFETASDITGNDEMIYIADMNNSQIQTYKRTMEPLFHFGGYGGKSGNFIEIRGIFADNDFLYTASIDSFSQKKGRIQQFTKNGLYKKTFDQPGQRSDFLRVTKTKDNFIVGITEGTICIYTAMGKLVKETNQVSDVPFLFLQDVSFLPDKTFAFVDRGRRGFFIANSGLDRIRLFGEEYVSIPVAISSYQQKIFIADANGTIFCFTLDGKFVKSIVTNLYINGLFHLNSNTIFATSALRQGLFEIDWQKETILEKKIEPTKDLELHWPNSVCIDSEKNLYVNDDYTSSIKILSAQNGQYVKEVGTINKIGIKASSLAVVDPNHIYLISKSNNSLIYQFSNNNDSQMITGAEDQEYVSLKTDPEGAMYAFDVHNQVIEKYLQNQRILRIPLPKSGDIPQDFYVFDSVYVSYPSGEILVLNKKTGAQEYSIQLQLFGSPEEYRNFLVFDKNLILSSKTTHMIKIYALPSGEILKTYGNIGGPKTYVPKENIQVDINFESGKFLFPEGIYKEKDFLYVADSGNHRIQKIPYSFLFSKDNLITLKVGSLVGGYNFKSIKLDTPPFISKNRLFVPIRFIAETFKTVVDWEPKTEKITIKEENVTIEFWIGMTKMKVNNKELQIDAPPQIRNNRTFVPIRFLSEALGASVNWDPDKQTVTIRR